MIKKATMAAFSTKPAKHYNVRSISLPTRSHPTTLRVEEELNKLTSREMYSSSSKAEKIWSGLSGLGELYKCIVAHSVYFTRSQIDSVCGSKHEPQRLQLLQMEGPDVFVSPTSLPVKHFPVQPVEPNKPAIR
ncbi:hypothetical protein Patl1_29216 [Pistacia atlantica]|uniref:Uncharacterized protein n=1 Tax=Pistacia atlantica TaxID=434234 RepID=A0ACC1BGR3_9ROSI|nr:hypothetical protein Patl1_29216 [Pistacia atlantica]